MTSGSNLLPSYPTSGNSSQNGASATFKFGFLLQSLHSSGFQPKIVLHQLDPICLNPAISMFFTLFFLGACGPWGQSVQGVYKVLIWLN